MIEGAKPITLEVVEEALLKRVKRNLTTTWDVYDYIIEKGMWNISSECSQERLKK